MAILDGGNISIVVDGSDPSFQDFGGNDTYTISPVLSGNVTIEDNNASTIILPPGMTITAARFLADGVEFTVNGNTVTFLGDPSLFSFVFGGSNIDPTEGAPLDFSATAAAFGTTVPAPGEGFNVATTTGDVNADGSVAVGSKIIDLSDQTDVTAVDGVAETFVLEFDSSSGSALSSDAVVTVTGFDPAEDILRFDDTNGTPQDAVTFLDASAGGALVVSNGFEDETKINFQDDNDTDTAQASEVTLVGITDATLGGGTPFFEIV